MRIEMDEPIIEEGATGNDQPDLQRLKPRSWLCAFSLHRRTRWSEPFARKGIPTFVFFSLGSTSPTESTFHYQARECLGCGEREERSV